MSLESKIDSPIEAINAQTTAVNAFNGNIEKWLTAPSIVVKEENVRVTRGEQQMELPLEEPEQSENPKADDSSTLTHKDVQDAVLAFVREDVKTNKPKVKNLLDKYEANKVSDIKEADLSAFQKELGEL